MGESLLPGKGTPTPTPKPTKPTATPTTMPFNPTVDPYPTRHPTATTGPGSVPAAITVELSRDYVIADGKDRVTVSARVLDQHGSPVPDGTKVDFMIDDPAWQQASGPGSLMPSGGDAWGLKLFIGVQTMGGVARVDYGNVSPANGDGTLKITASSTDDDNVRSSATVKVLALKIDIDFSRDFVIADNADRVTINAKVTDSQGHSVTDGTKVNFAIDDPAWQQASGPGSLMPSGGDAWGLKLFIGVQTMGGVARVDYGNVSPASAGRQIRFDASISANGAINTAAALDIVSTAAAASMNSTATPGPTEPGAGGSTASAQPASSATIAPNATAPAGTDNSTPAASGATATPQAGSPWLPQVAGAAVLFLLIEGIGGCLAGRGKKK